MVVSLGKRWSVGRGVYETVMNEGEKAAPACGAGAVTADNCVVRCLDFDVSLDSCTERS